MSQLDMFTPPAAEAEAEPLQHENLYISKKHKDRLIELRKIHREKITKRMTKRIRKAAEDAIDAEWRLICKISGQDPDLGF
jgi:hypothetical protein